MQSSLKKMYFFSSTLLFALVINYVGCDAAESTKEYVRDASKFMEEANTHTIRDRVEIACGTNERVLNLSFTTDNYGYETSFQLSRVGENSPIGFGPEPNANFDDNETYNESYCVRVGQQYTLLMKDRMNDGFCCNMGKGTYSYGLDGDILFDSAQKRTFNSVATHTIMVGPKPSSLSNTILAAGSKSDSTGCITVEVKADRHADELSWSILRNGNSVARNGPLEAFTPVSKRVCLPSGQYEIVFKDTHGDGLCCGSGDGYIKIFLDGREMIRGTHFKYEKRYTVMVDPRFEENMSARDNEWLVAHNERREKYHPEFGVSYVPLQWSPQLAIDAKRWATELLSDCDSPGLRHEKNVMEGENLAKNKGSGSYGELYPADNILHRWVEKERWLGYPRNAHMTQCLWRATKHVGCGEAVKSIDGSRETCRIQVCRYAKAGNCNMDTYNAKIENNWIRPMIEENTKCGPECPPEGCW